MPEELEKLSQHEIKVLKETVKKIDKIHIPSLRKGGLYDCAKYVLTYYNLDFSHLTSHRRNKKWVMARRDFIHLALKKTNATYTKIAGFLGNRDHTTILYHARKDAFNLEQIMNTMNDT